MIKNIENYYLNMPVKEMFDLAELSLEEYKTYESVGIKKIFKDEKIYNGKDINFIGAVWNTLIGATEGRAYKISLQHITSDKDDADKIFKLAYDYLFKEMGKHSEYNPSTKRYFWDTNEGNVILDQPCGMGIHSVQLFLTSSIIRKQTADKAKELYDAWKASERMFRVYTTSLSSYPVIISIVMLFLAFLHMPHGYYTLMRLVVCGTAIYGAYKANKLNKQGWMWLMGLVALLFNPIVPISFHKATWRIIDFVVALLFITFLFKNTKTGLKI